MFNDNFFKMCMNCALFFKRELQLSVDNVHNFGDKVVITKLAVEKIF